MAEYEISFRLLETLTFALYEDPIILFREYVQNSLDAYNEMVGGNAEKRLDNFHVDIEIDKENKNIEIRDNGYGIEEEQFEQTMKRIGDSNKHNIKDQIGFRGIGRLSAMPLCKELVFENKPEGKDKRQIFKWDGEKFISLLNKGEDINASIGEITEYYPEDYDGDIIDHYFKVTIREYGQAIKGLFNKDKHIKRLCTLLPLRYSQEFTRQAEIKKKYLDFMREPLDKFECKVVLDGVELYKPYANEDVLASGIVFWDLKIPSDEEGTHSEKIGILWFTFGHLIKKRQNEGPYGILVRSKNMLMGDQYALARDADRSTSEYITTLRELSQALNGVCGEMLIKYDGFNDNSSRDWFRIDDKSVKLRHIIVEFMRRLHEYRYAASDYVNKLKDNSEQRYIEALRNLKSSYDIATLITDMRRLRKETEASQESFYIANEDIPSESVTIKRFYERLIQCLYNYYEGKGEIKELIEIRKYIRDHLNKEQKE
ncbi:MAG TPA: ATP-binding protein [Dehalococcoidia bacterium]|nr:ATP-binding protein [Dehalococcoidia bacterium]